MQIICHLLFLLIPQNQYHKHNFAQDHLYESHHHLKFLRKLALALVNEGVATGGLNLRKLLEALKNEGRLVGTLAVFCRTAAG